MRTQATSILIMPRRISKSFLAQRFLVAITIYANNRFEINWTKNQNAVYAHLMPLNAFCRRREEQKLKTTNVECVQPRQASGPIADCSRRTHVFARPREDAHSSTRERRRLLRRGRS